MTRRYAVLHSPVGTASLVIMLNPWHWSRILRWGQTPALRRGVEPMTKIQMGVAAAAAAVLAFGVAACGQTTTVEEPAATTEEAAPEAAPAEVPADPAAAPADPAAAPAEGAAPAPATP